MAAKRQAFRAQLVMEDSTCSPHKLRRSKRHGELVLDGNKQSVQMVYPRLRRIFQSRFEQPLKCVAGRKLLRVYSSNGKKNFTCRLLSDEDMAECIETLRNFGVEVICVGESMLLPRQTHSIQEDTLAAGCEAALQAIRDASQESIRADIQDYERSTQLQADTEIIMRAMFSGPRRRN
ncbi:hypothetical protein PHYBOEH_006232 [Phytophthora boehmeriae]|uniref:Uncharacterized protein n=1 Tax=Phytophthora boehmeriae TaxID=109152 RepID=A0A8T1X224_9STRA|nr:hypothetical protein PHYBOEH_006232 [Phytophthora boehmeriae]